MYEPLAPAIAAPNPASKGDGKPRRLRAGRPIGCPIGPRSARERSPLIRDLSRGGTPHG